MREMVDRKGFTLVELLVVMFIIAILVTGIVGVFSRVKAKGQVTSLLDEIHSVKTAYNSFNDDTGFFPADGNIQVLYDPSQFTTTNYPGCDPDKWRGPYLSPPKGDVTQAPINPFGGAIQAYYDSTTGNYGIVLSNIPVRRARDLDVKYDGQADGTKGNILYDDTQARTDVTVIFGQE